MAEPAAFAGIAFRVLGPVRSLIQKRRRVHLRVHRAQYIGDPTPHYFLNAVNMSASREIEITHAWFEGSPDVHILTNLPKRLKPDAQWGGVDPAS